MILAANVVLALAGLCQSVVAPTTILKIATHESKLDTAAVHQNKDGSRDIGLMQINEKNLKWLGLTYDDALNPCRSISAAATLLASFSRYNTGSPTRGIENGYAMAVLGEQESTNAPQEPVSSPPKQRPSVFIRRASAGRQLVFLSSKER